MNKKTITTIKNERGCIMFSREIKPVKYLFICLLLICYKEMAGVIMKAGKYKICRMSQQVGEPRG